MEKVMSVNEMISAIRRNQRKIWNVVINGKVVQGVSATDNRKSTAEAYIAQKYPNTEFALVFACWKN